MHSLLGEDFDAFIKSYQSPHHVGLRVNELKISRESWMEKSPFGQQMIPFTSNGFYYNENDKPAKHPYFHAGLYYIQEPSAMMPAEIMPIVPGDLVLDLCAAPGGKSTQLAAKLKGTGLLVSNDISPSRAKVIVKNIELMGIKNAIVMSENPTKLESYFENYFDKILVDAPCSGEGMFRKEPSMIKNYIKDGPAHYIETQRSILRSASKMLKPGGLMVYSTCTFSPEENEDNIEWLLNTIQEIEIINIPKANGVSASIGNIQEAIRLWPHRLQGEGHFVALLRKKMSEFQVPLDKKYDPPSEQEIEPFRAFEDEVLKTKISTANLWKNGDKLYQLPNKYIQLHRLRILRSGWYLGEISKGRYEPSQAFASGLKTEEIKSVIDLEVGSIEVIKYLKGETLNLDVKKGNYIVSTDHFPLGFAKCNGSQLKNKYDASWRMQ